MLARKNLLDRAIRFVAPGPGNERSVYRCMFSDHSWPGENNLCALASLRSHSIDDLRMLHHLFHAFGKSRHVAGREEQTCGSDNLRQTANIGSNYESLPYH